MTWHTVARIAEHVCYDVYANERIGGIKCLENQRNQLESLMQSR